MIVWFVKWSLLFGTAGYCAYRSDRDGGGLRWVGGAVAALLLAPVML